MPVKNIFGSGNKTSIGGGSGSGNVSCSLVVDPTMPDPCVFVGAFFGSAVDTSAATFAAVINDGSDHVMDLVDELDWTVAAVARSHTLKMYSLLNPPTGGSGLTAKVSFTSMPTEVVSRPFIMVAGVYSGVDSLDDTPVVAAPSGSTTANDVTVTSDLEAENVVSVHAVGLLNAFTGYSQAIRARQNLLGGDVILGDARGNSDDGDILMHGSMLIPTVDWGAIGIRVIPSTVTAGASVGLPSIGMTANSGIARIHPPAPWRTFKASRT